MARTPWTWKEDITGNKYHRLTVVGFAERRGSAYYWRCVCDCGTARIVGRSALVSGITKSCGCFNKERVAATQTTHGKSHTPEYNSWLAMNMRCKSPKAKGYEHYGGRGVIVCDRWASSFENFYEDMGPRPDGTTLDRIDPEGNYEPLNCRWLNHATNCAIKRKTMFVTFRGETKTIADWARHSSIPYTTLWQRIARNGWSIDRAITEPLHKHQMVAA
jgi:hypothetical protein